MSSVTPPSQACKPDGTFDVFAAHRAVAASSLTPSARLLAHTLIIHMNKDGVCWPSVALLCRETGLGNTTVCRVMKEIHEAGLIVRVQMPRSTTSRYQWFRLGTTATVIPPWKVRRPVKEPPVILSRNDGHSVAGYKHLTDHPISNNQVNGGESAPVLSREVVWKIVQDEHRKLSLDRHGTPGIPTAMKQADRENIAAFFIEATEQARGEWPGDEKITHGADKWCEFVVREVLTIWFDREGTGGWLEQHAHPLHSLLRDLGGVHADWRESWTERVERHREATF